MDKIQIYGILNEDREIVFISDCQSVDWDPDYCIEDDVDWKMIKLNNKELMNEIDGIYWDENIVILEKMDINDKEKIKETLGKWIKIIKPKYVLNYISPADLMTFRMKQEREWEEEDRKWLEMENMDAIDCNM